MEFFIYFILFKNNFQLLVFLLGILSALRVFSFGESSRVYKLFVNLFFISLGLVVSVEIFRFYFYIDALNQYFYNVIENFMEVFGLAVVFSVILFLSKNRAKLDKSKFLNSQKFSIYEV